MAKDRVPKRRKFKPADRNKVPRSIGIRSPPTPEWLTPGYHHPPTLDISDEECDVLESLDGFPSGEFVDLSSSDAGTSSEGNYMPVEGWPQLDPTGGGSDEWARLKPPQGLAED